MKQHPDWCAKRDEPLAVALWQSNRPALLTVWCGNRRHRLARVYDLPDQGEVLCVPAWTYLEQAMERGSRDHGDGEAHAHAGLTPLAAGNLPEAQGCSCGIYLISFDRLRQFRGAGLDTMLAEQSTTRRTP